jgi:hypothetical protein
MPANNPFNKSYHRNAFPLSVVDGFVRNSPLRQIASDLVHKDEAGLSFILYDARVANLGAFI